MPKQIRMPKLSDTMEEGTLLAWRVREGDTIHRGEVLAEIETDKADMEFESFTEGTVQKLLVEPGRDRRRGTPDCGHPPPGRVGEEDVAAAPRRRDRGRAAERLPRPRRREPAPAGNGRARGRPRPEFPSCAPGVLPAPDSLRALRRRGRLRPFRTRTAASHPAPRAAWRRSARRPDRARGERSGRRDPRRRRRGVPAGARDAGARSRGRARDAARAAHGERPRASTSSRSRGVVPGAHHARRTCSSTRGAMTRTGSPSARRSSSAARSSCRRSARR